MALSRPWPWTGVLARKKRTTMASCSSDMGIASHSRRWFQRKCDILRSETLFPNIVRTASCEQAMPVAQSIHPNRLNWSYERIPTLCHQVRLFLWLPPQTTPSPPHGRIPDRAVEPPPTRGPSSHDLAAWPPVPPRPPSHAAAPNTVGAVRTEWGCSTSPRRLSQRERPGNLWGMTSFTRLNDGWNAELNAPDLKVRVEGTDPAVVQDEPPAVSRVRRGATSVSCAHAVLGGIASATNDKAGTWAACRFSGTRPRGEFYEVSGDLRLGQCPDDWIQPPSGTQRHATFCSTFEMTCLSDAESWTPSGEGVATEVAGHGDDKDVCTRLRPGERRGRSACRRRWWSGVPGVDFDRRSAWYVVRTSFCSATCGMARAGAGLGRVFSVGLVIATVNLDLISLAAGDRVFALHDGGCCRDRDPQAVLSRCRLAANQSRFAGVVESASALGERG